LADCIFRVSFIRLFRSQGWLKIGRKTGLILRSELALEGLKMRYFRGDWTINVSKGEGFLRGRYCGLFRDAVRSRKFCHQFTLFKDKDSDEAIIQLQIFLDGTIQSWAYEPCMVRVNHGRKLVVIGVFRPEVAPWIQRKGRSVLYRVK
jgi:hypothetical protein